MSISSEISRISGNIADAFDAIEDKGVTVPSDSTSDDLADLIAQIPTGSTEVVSIVDTTDTAGGTIRTITAIDISDSTVTASDVLNSKYFYTAQGVKTQGTASGGGGGLVYETGTYTPTSDVAEQSISFLNAHTDPPVYVCLSDASDSYDATTNSNYLFIYTDFEKISGFPIYPSSGSENYAIVYFRYRGTSTSSITYTNLALSHPSSDTTDSSSTYPRYWVNASRFKASSNSDSRYWRSGRTYKWIAVWAPTT